LEAFFAAHDGVARLAAPPCGEGSVTGPPGQATAGDGVAADPIPTTLPAGATAMPAMPAGTGRVGDYILLEELGRGGMGVVYNAWQHGLSRHVALKMILAGPLASPADIQRFRIEAEAVARLDHPHIVPIYEFGEHQGHWFFSMKLITGSSLDKRLRRYRKDPRAAARLVIAIARAMHHAHQRGIMHRDLKPSNILARRRGSAARHRLRPGQAGRDPADLTRTGAFVGTMTYTSPEQASCRKGAVTAAADLYSLGAILYALLTGGPPFPAKTVTRLKVMQEDPRRPRAINPAVPPDLEAICLRCLEKDPQKRFGSADALANDLERWLRGEPTLTRPVRGVDRLGRWCRRHPIAASLPFLTLGLLCTATAATVRVARLARPGRRGGPCPGGEAGAGGLS
jgi:serine/threonine-protein kinase